MIGFLIGIQTAIFFAYLRTVYSYFGILPSISDSWYELKAKQEGSQKNFTFFLWAIAIPLMVTGGLTGNVFYFISGACLCFTGATGAFRERITREVHYTGACGGMLSALVGLWVDGLHAFPILAATAAYALYRFKAKNKIWWIEVIVFGFTVTGLFIVYVLQPSEIRCIHCFLTKQITQLIGA